MSGQVVAATALSRGCIWGGLNYGAVGLGVGKCDKNKIFDMFCYQFSFLAFQEARNYFLKSSIDEDKVDDYLDKEYRKLLKDLRAYST